jgi:hypothetical protein
VRGGRLRRCAAVVAVLVTVGLALPSSASSASAIPGFPDCKDAPTPEVPGRGIAGFFLAEPDQVPEHADPFAADAETTMFEQYGYAGLRWHGYDLGCGPAAMRQPDVVIGTALSNWIMQAPIALASMTSSVTQVAFEPTFLDSFDGVIERVSTALHQNLFVSWIPVVLAALGILIIFRARRSALATSAACAGWALLVVLVTTALFRWPVEAGQAADATVTGTLGAVVGELDGHREDVDPGTAVASNVGDSLLYRAWVAGALGNPDSRAAETYGPALFKAQALTWHEAAILEDDPERGTAIIEDKQETWKQTADRIKEEDPEAYEYLTGRRSETRIGYAVLSTIAVFLALPFLLMSSLLLLGCYLIVRLAVMMFPAFATLGAFPASRGVVIGLGRTVGAALVNAVVFGIGAGITIAVLGILLRPGGGAPGWLGLVLMPLFSLVMWVALKPFRRLTTMVSPDRAHFGDMAGAMGAAGRSGRRWGKKLTIAGLGAATGGAAGVAAAAGSDDEDRPPERPPERSEALPRPDGAPRTAPQDRPWQDHAQRDAASTPRLGADAERPALASAATPSRPAPDQLRTAALNPGFVPVPGFGGVPDTPPVEPIEEDGEEIYTIYRPGTDDFEEDAELYSPQPGLR